MSRSITNNNKPSKKASYNIEGCLGIISTLGNITPQLDYVGAPNNSELIKLPILPKNNPIGATTDTKSDK